MVNLELYRVFYTVAKCGSLTRAADELFISQPAVSQAIKQLEGQLGTPLFNRTHRGMACPVFSWQVRPSPACRHAPSVLKRNPAFRLGAERGMMRPWGKRTG